MKRYRKKDAENIDTVRRYLLSTNMLVIHLLTLSNNLLKSSTKEEQMDG